jgi:hypothetical protein
LHQSFPFFKTKVVIHFCLWCQRQHSIFGSLDDCYPKMGL